MRPNNLAADLKQPQSQEAAAKPKVSRYSTASPTTALTLPDLALLRVQRREVRPRRVHALLDSLGSASRMSRYGWEVQELYGWLWLQPTVRKEECHHW